MDEVLAFVRKFIQQEYEFNKILHTERDDASMQAARAQIRAYFADDFANFDQGPDYRRPSQPDNTFFEDGQLQFDRGWIVPRTFFQLKQYQHPEIGQLFRAYTSSIHRSEPGHNGYANNFFITRQNNDLRIITRYRLHDPRGRGRVMITDHGLMWAASGGLKIQTMGKLVAVHKLEPPDQPADRAEYDAE